MKIIYLGAHPIKNFFALNLLYYYFSIDNQESMMTGLKKYRLI